MKKSPIETVLGILVILVAAFFVHFAANKIDAKPQQGYEVTAVFMRPTGGDGFGPAERFASRLWNSPPLGCWVHPDGRFLGSAAPVGSDYRIVFYQNKDSLSADARLLLPKTRTLAPNETIRFQPPRTGAMLHYLGTGGREEFLARVKATAEFLK